MIRFFRGKIKKIFFVALTGIFVLLVIFTPSEAKAVNLFGISDFTAGALTIVAQVFSYIFGFIAGILFWISTLLLKLALNINFEILNSLIVKTGWQITLNFANLGFVLAIIVIAFATIFRMESYAMKQTLWKLIVAALLVNFSLVIAGAFISLSDSLSYYLIDATTAGSTPGAHNITGWGDTFAGMFRAQELLKMNENSKAEGVLGTTTEALNVVGSAVLINIASLFFIALFTFLVCLTVLAAAIMLLIRYVYLGFLLILSPIVWLLWIFPGTSKHWSKWWDDFLRWTFFTPLMLFFLYLAIFSIKGQSDMAKNIFNNDPASASVNLTFGIEVIGDMVIAIFMSMIGLMAANKLSIIGAGAAYGMGESVIKGAGSAAGNFAKKQTLQRGLGWMNRPGKEGKSFADKAAQWSATSKLAKWSGLGYAAQGITKLAAAGGENQMKQAKDSIKGKSVNELTAMLGTTTFDRAKKAAILQELRDKDSLNKIPNVDNYLTHGERANWQALGQGKEFEKLEKKLGRSVEMVTGKNSDNKEISFEEAVEKHYENYNLADWQGVSPGVFTDKKYGDTITKNMLKDYPAALGKIAPKIKKADWDKFTNQINTTFEKIKIEVPSDIGDKIGKSIEKNLGGRFTGWGPEEKEEKKAGGEEKKEEKKEERK
ncbi:hypothetical protein HZC33_02755 [Candidatus Wolfebacteria bacterium]|nr:hypothetical protein [Candidatus Wolfebacteria bacterium]